MKTSASLVILACLSFASCEKAQETKETTNLASSPAPVVSTQEQAAKDAVKLQEELATVMESITDAATAEKAIAALAPIAERFSKLGKSVQEMDKNLPPEEDAKLKQLLKPSEERLQKAMGTAMPIISQHPEIAKKMQDAMAKMNTP